jgi:hypothetical protein
LLLLLDPDGFELGGLRWGDSDEQNQAAVVDVVLGHRRVIAADKERVVGFGAGQCAAAPKRSCDRGGVIPRAHPKRRPVRLTSEESELLLNVVAEAVCNGCCGCGHQSAV